MRLLLYGAVLAAGSLLVAVTGRLAWMSWSAMRSTPEAPLETTVEDAPDRRWVRPTDLALRCETRVASRGFTFLLAEGGPSRTPVAVHLVGDVPCPTAPPDGVFIPGTFTRAWFEEAFGVVFPGADAKGPEVRLLTRALAPEYQRQAMLRSLPWLGFGLLMLFIGGRGLFRATRGKPPVRGPAPRGG